MGENRPLGAAGRLPEVPVLGPVIRDQDSEGTPPTEGYRVEVVHVVAEYWQRTVTDADALRADAVHGTTQFLRMVAAKHGNHTVFPGEWLHMPCVRAQDGRFVPVCDIVAELRLVADIEDVLAGFPTLPPALVSSALDFAEDVLTFNAELIDYREAQERLFLESDPAARRLLAAGG